MANINFGILDTQLPGRIAAIPQEAQKQQTANMLQAMQVQGAMREGQMSQMKIDEMVAERKEIDAFAANLKARGYTQGSKGFFTELASSRNPARMQQGFEGLRRLEEQDQFDAYQQRQSAKRTNALAPSEPGAPVNAMLADLQDEARALSMLKDPRAKDELAFVRDRIKQITQPRVVGPSGSVVVEGVPTYTAPAAVPPSRRPNLATDLLIPGPNNTMVPNTALIGVQTELKQAGRTPAQPRPEQPAQPVIDPDTGKQILVSREEAIRRRMTPANAAEGLAPKEIQKREAALPAATSAVTGFETKSKSFVKDLETLRDHPGLSSITGIAAGRMPGLTANGRAAQALYDKIVAKGGFQALQDLRDASKTGGALGNVSNQEGKQLTSSFAAIDRRQAAEDVQAAINQAIADIEGARTRTREAYDSTYSYKSAAGQAAPAGAGKPSLADIFGGKKP